MWKLAKKLKSGDIIRFQGFKNAYGLAVKTFSLIKPKSVWESVERELDNLRYCFIDLETTSFKWKENEIIEIGYVIWKKRIIKKKSFLVKPKSIDDLKSCNIYENIDVLKLREAETIDKILPILKKDAENCIIVSHNLKSFDYHHLKKVGFFENKKMYYFFDTVVEGRKMSKKEDYKGSASLQDLIRNFRKDFSFEEKHRALDDSLLHLELFKKIIEGKKSLNFYFKIH